MSAQAVKAELRASGAAPLYLPGGLAEADVLDALSSEPRSNCVLFSSEVEQGALPINRPSGDAAPFGTGEDPPQAIQVAFCGNLSLEELRTRFSTLFTTKSMSWIYLNLWQTVRRGEPEPQPAKRVPVLIQWTGESIPVKKRVRASDYNRAVSKLFPRAARDILFTRPDDLSPDSLPHVIDSKLGIASRTWTVSEDYFFTGIPNGADPNKLPARNVPIVRPPENLKVLREAIKRNHEGPDADNSTAGSKDTGEDDTTGLVEPAEEPSDDHVAQALDGAESTEGTEGASHAQDGPLSGPLATVSEVPAYQSDNVAPEFAASLRELVQTAYTGQMSPAVKPTQNGGQPQQQRPVAQPQAPPPPSAAARPPAVAPSARWIDSRNYLIEGQDGQVINAAEAATENPPGAPATPFNAPLAPPTFSVEGKQSATVQIFSCRHITVEVHGKVNSIQVRDCTHLHLSLDACISEVSLINTDFSRITVSESCPTMGVENSSDIRLVYKADPEKVNVVTTKTQRISLEYAGSVYSLPDVYVHRLVLQEPPGAPDDDQDEHSTEYILMTQEQEGV